MLAASDEGVATAALVDDAPEVPELVGTFSSGSRIIIEEFMHWEAGSRVALAVKVMSAHC